MRPHSLRVSGFGPFADSVEISWDRLAENGLFLLQGETGAGKTSLLDAIGFALYGRVPGERGKSPRLRSDYAPPDVRTEVRLVVTVAGRMLRITRSPAQERPKRRGQGTTTEPARVLLEEHTATGWRSVSTRAGEADAELVRLLGMSAEQFFQVVLLPQGEFATFLRAPSEERGKLLERLFGMDRFRSAEAWLADQRRRVAAALDAQHATARELAARVAQVVQAGPLDDLPDVIWPTQLLTSANEAVRDSAVHLAGLKGELGEALAAEKAVRSLVDRQNRRRAAQLRHLELVADAANVAVVSDELVAAQKAAECAPLIGDVARTQHELAMADAQVAVAREAAGVKDDIAALSLRSLADDERERCGTLESLRIHVETARAEDATVAERQLHAETLAMQITGFNDVLTVMPERRTVLEADCLAARRSAEQLPVLRAAAERYASAFEDAAGADNQRVQLERLNADLLVARENAVELRDAAQRLREARFDSMTGELAAELIDDSPCPVCGSVEHPDPSPLHGQRVSRDEEEAASRIADEARDTAEQIRVQVAVLRGSLEQYARRLTADGLADLSSADLQTRSAAAAAELVEAEQVAAGVEAAEGLLRDSDAEWGDVKLQKTRLAGEHQATLKERDAAAERANVARALVHKRLAGAPDLDAAIDSARLTAAALDACADAMERRKIAEQEHERAKRQAGVAAVGAGFASAMEAESALRSVEWRIEADARLTDHREKLAAVESALAEPDLQVPLEPTADVPGAEAAVAAVSEAHEMASNALAQAKACAEQLADLVPALTTSLRDVAPLARRAEHVKALADLVAGQGANTMRMTLSAFVLAARLEEVAEAASGRLLAMTQGRYSLMHTDDGARNGARSGLGLRVCDAWTGHDRTTSSLSGGETFMASLAMALGLSDVVTAESGGRQLGSLFVDEGFGSLDDVALDDVLDVLDGLREGGRMVGVVSHVSEMRQRIPAQVQVRKGRSGSDVTVLAG